MSSVKVGVRRGLRGAVAVLLWAAPLCAQERAWTVDVTPASYVEAWNFNDNTERLIGVQAGLDRAVWRGVAVRGEGLLLRVHQDGDDTWLRGATLAMRARRRVRSAQVALDIGAGTASAAQRVPPAGTRFNYLLILGGNLEVPWSRAHLTAGLRWFHVSNAGREGDFQNPDTQALGGYAGVGWRF